MALSEKEIEREIRLTLTTQGIREGSKEFDRFSKRIEKAIKKNKELIESQDDLKYATKEVVKSSRKWGSVIEKTSKSVKGFYGHILKGVNAADKYNKNILGASVVMRQFGNSHQKVKKDLSSLATQLHLTKAAVAELAEAYYTTQRFVSSAGFESMAKRIEAVWGPDPQRQKQIMGFISSLGQEYPMMAKDLANIENLNQEQVASLKSQLNTLRARDKIQVGQHRMLLAYLEGSSKLTKEEREQMQVVADIKVAFNELYITVGKLILPYVKDVTDFLKSWIKDGIKFKHVLLAGLVVLTKMVGLRTTLAAGRGIVKGAGFVLGGAAKAGAAAKATALAAGATKAGAAGAAASAAGLASALAIAAPIALAVGATMLYISHVTKKAEEGMRKLKEETIELNGINKEMEAAKKSGSAKGEMAALNKRFAFYKKKREENKKWQATWDLWGGGGSWGSDDMEMKHQYDQAGRMMERISRQKKEVRGRVGAEKESEDANNQINESLNRQVGLSTKLKALAQAQSGLLSAMVKKAVITGEVDDEGFKRQQEKARGTMELQASIAKKYAAYLAKMNPEEKISKATLAKKVGLAKDEFELAKATGGLDENELTAHAQMAQCLTDEKNLQASITENSLQHAKMYEGRIKYAQAEVGLMQSMVSLADNLMMGVGASVQMRVNLFKANEKVIISLKQQRQAAVEQLEAGNNVLANKQQILEIDQKILQTQVSQAQSVRALRDGWVDAISSMNTGAGTFTKIILTQQQGNAAALRMGGEVSRVSGFLRGGGRGPAPKFGSMGGITGNEPPPYGNQSMQEAYALRRTVRGDARAAMQLGNQMQAGSRKQVQGAGRGLANLTGTLGGVMSGETGKTYIFNVSMSGRGKKYFEKGAEELVDRFDRGAKMPP